MRSTLTVSLVASALVASLIGCGGGSKSTPSTPPSGPTPPTTGYLVPTEISPVSPTRTQGLAASRSADPSLLAQGSAPLVTAPADSDYAKALTSRFVDEHAIDQFSIIETILNAMAQTHYADAENLNAGPYKSIVTWQENGKDSGGVTIQTWVVDSRMVKQQDDTYLNVVDVWIEDSGQVIKGQFQIAASAAKRADGSYLNYGRWTLNVKFDDANTTYFYARADVDAGGDTILAINNHEVHGSEVHNRKGVVHKGDTAGYGKVTYTEWVNNAPTDISATYAYNASQLLENAGSGNVYKDRAATVDIVQKYGVYLSDTGADVLKTHTFGFPVSYTSGGATVQGYYGAWQGMHSLWSQNNSVPADGTQVTRLDANGTGLTYTTVSFPGTLTRRSLVASSLSGLLNLPLQTWVNFQHQLSWNGTQWAENGSAFTAWSDLAPALQKNVWINTWSNNQMLNLVYDPNGGQGAGFYVATLNNGMPTSTGQLFTPAPGANLWINISGAIFLQYTGSGWVQKQVTAFDANTGTPTFGPSDTPYTLVPNYQYYLNMQGTNYVVTQSDSGASDVQVEIQTPCNPVNLAASPSVLGTAVAFRSQYGNAQDPTTFAFGTDPASPTFMKLICTHVGSGDTQSQLNQPVTQGLYGLVAVDGGGQAVGQYNWNYPSQGNTFGTQTFLYTLDAGQNRVYKLVDSPISFTSTQLVTNAGATRSYSLRYDGWMQGLPQWDNLLAQNGWTITDAVAAQVVNIPAQTVLQDLNTASVTYLVKPLEVGVYLKTAAVPDATLTLTQANAIDLSAAGVLPVFPDNAMGAEPTNLRLKYIAGLPAN